MPLFEYACQTCGHEFEVLVRPGDTGEWRCADCGSERVNRLFSTFAVSSAARRQASFDRAHAENDKLRRDRRVALERANKQAHDDHHDH